MGSLFWGCNDFELGDTQGAKKNRNKKTSSKELSREATSKKDSTRFHQRLVAGWTMNFGGCLWCTGIDVVDVLHKKVSSQNVTRSVKCGLGILVIDQNWKYRCIV